MDVHVDTIRRAIAHSSYRTDGYSPVRLASRTMYLSAHVGYVTCHYRGHVTGGETAEHAAINMLRRLGCNVTRPQAVAAYDADPFE